MSDDTDAIARLEQVLLGGSRKYTRQEVAELTGTPPEVGKRLWRALGFPDVADDEKYFTDSDVTALQVLRTIQEAGVVDTELAVTNARAMARQLAQLADWQVAIFVERFLAADPDAASKPDLIASLLEQIVPQSEKLVVYVWRRRLAAAGGRLLASVEGEVSTGTLAVGFADLVGYTRLTRGLDEAELSHLLDSFESQASDVVAAVGGRIVKMIGDEVMFVADDVVTAAEIGLTLADSFHGGADPEVHVGIAWGSVLSRLGDVYGTTVNLASRLTSVAKPGSVLVDRAAATVLEQRPEFAVKPVPRQRARGFGTVEAFVVRRRVRV